MNKMNNIQTSLVSALRVAGSVLFLSLFAFVSVASANEANLTRFGPKVYDRERGAPTNDDDNDALVATAGASCGWDGTSYDANGRLVVNDVMGPPDGRWPRCHRCIGAGRPVGPRNHQGRKRREFLARLHRVVPPAP